VTLIFATLAFGFDAIKMPCFFRIIQGVGTAPCRRQCDTNGGIATKYMAKPATVAEKCFTKSGTQAAWQIWQPSESGVRPRCRSLPYAKLAADPASGVQHPIATGYVVNFLRAQHFTESTSRYLRILPRKRLWTLEFLVASLLGTLPPGAAPRRPQEFFFFNPPPLDQKQLERRLSGQRSRPVFGRVVQAPE